MSADRIPCGLHALASALRQCPAPAQQRAWQLATLQQLAVHTGPSQKPFLLRLPDRVRQPWLVPDQVAERVTELAGELDPANAGTRVERTVRRMLLEDVLCWPAQLLGEAGGKAAGGDAERWELTVRLAEAVWEVLSRAAQRGDHDAERRRSLFARTRFLLLSEPFRYPGGGNPLADVTGRALGREAELAGRAAQAREVWANELLAYQDRPALAGWPPEWVEEDLKLLAFCQRPGSRLKPLLLTPPAGQGGASGLQWEHATLTWLAREGFLPRFMLGAALRATAEAGPSRRLRWAALLAPLLLLAAAILAPAAALAAGQVLPATALTWAACLAGGAYLLVLGAVLYRPELGDPACLRLPAVAVLGAAALISLRDDWASAPPWHVPLAAGGAALAYLAVQARNAGAARWQALARAAGVGLLGFLHGLAVTVVIARAVAPSVAEGWQLPLQAPGAFTRAVATVAAIALLLGVVLQVLWEDRPVTAPLTMAHRHGQGGAGSTR